MSEKKRKKRKKKYDSEYLDAERIEPRKNLFDR